MKENKKIFQKTSNSNKGITLVALVITIVILIILATVAINFAFGNNGLINRASDAKEYYANDTAYTEEALSNVESYIDGILGENGTEESGTTVADAKTNGTEFETTTPIEDDLENTVYIPGGFKVAEDSGTTVEEGIVIEDANGNQFVWIPVGEYKVSTTINAEGKLTNNLSRRTFTSSGATEVDGVDTAIDTYFYAEDTIKYTSVAKDTIGAFKYSATTKGGFYIGRYEQGTNNVCKAGVEPYVNVIRDTANSKAKEMYNGDNYVTSELISSYAWDTALNFICQTNVEEGKGYNLATTTSSTYGNLGTSRPTKTGKYKVNEVIVDKYSNIYDFLGNRLEWTSEYSTKSAAYRYPCVNRGGYYHLSNRYATGRYHHNTSNGAEYLGFRLQLYVRQG